MTSDKQFWRSECGAVLAVALRRLVQESSARPVLLLRNLKRRSVAAGALGGPVAEPALPGLVHRGPVAAGAVVLRAQLKHEGDVARTDP